MVLAGSASQVPLGAGPEPPAPPASPVPPPPAPREPLLPPLPPAPAAESPPGPGEPALPPVPSTPVPPAPAAPALPVSSEPDPPSPVPNEPSELGSALPASGPPENSPPAADTAASGSPVAGGAFSAPAMLSVLGNEGEGVGLAPASALPAPGSVSFIEPTTSELPGTLAGASVVSPSLMAPAGGLCPASEPAACSANSSKFIRPHEQTEEPSKRLACRTDVLWGTHTRFKLAPGCVLGLA